MTTKAELEAQLQKSNPAWWDNLPQIGAQNQYRCQQTDCHRNLITIDRDRGVTPMFIACRTKDGVLTGCKGPMVSYGYPPLSSKPKGLGPPTMEWYRPEASPIGHFDDNPEMEIHIRKGGLALRPVTEGQQDAHQH